jgi:hypothetical protein
VSDIAIRLPSTLQCQTSLSAYRPRFSVRHRYLSAVHASVSDIVICLPSTLSVSDIVIRLPSTLQCQTSLSVHRPRFQCQTSLSVRRPRFQCRIFAYLVSSD